MNHERLYATDAIFREVSDLLFGGGADELIAKAQSQTEPKKGKDKTLQNIAIAGNAASTVAGPAAIYSAARSAKNNAGGIPRDLASAAVGSQNKRTRFGRTKVGQKIGRGVDAINAPKSRKAKVAAGVAGGTLVGLQAINMGTDALSTKLLNDQKKKDQKVAKGVLVQKMSPTQSDISSSGRVGRNLRIAQEVGNKVEPKAKGMIRQVGATAKTKAGKLVAHRCGPKPSQVKVGKSHEDDWSFDCSISKLDEDKRQVFGWASVIEKDGRPIEDLQGDVIALEEAERAAYEFVKKSRKGGDMHRRNGEDPHHVSDMIESFLVTPEKIEKMGIPENSLPIGWWVGFQVNDDETWDLVKKQRRTGFSVHGRGKRTPL